MTDVKHYAANIATIIPCVIRWKLYGGDAFESPFWKRPKAQYLPRFIHFFLQYFNIIYFFASGQRLIACIFFPL